jgi:hypothetical protein
MIIALALPSKAHVLFPIPGEARINDQHAPCAFHNFNVRHTRASRMQAPLKIRR